MPWRPVLSETEQAQGGRQAILCHAAMNHAEEYLAEIYMEQLRFV